MTRHRLWQIVREDLFALGIHPRDHILNILFSGSFHLLLAHRITHTVHIHVSQFFARRLSDLIRIIYGCDISPGATIGAGTMFIHPFGVVIGDGAVIGEKCRIYNGVTIGNRKGENADGMACLENNVLVGSGAKILGAVKIGNGARIGANSVVLCDIPPAATAVGVPAKIIS